MPIETASMEHRHCDALRRIYEAEKIWADRGNQPRSFMLLHRGGMRTEVEHPVWDPSWAVPSEHTIDDLAGLALLRVEPSTNKARTFVLSMNGRKLGAALIAGTLTPSARLRTVPIPAGHEVSIEPAEQVGSASATPSAFVSWAHCGEQWQETIGDSRCSCDGWVFPLMSICSRHTIRR